MAAKKSLSKRLNEARPGGVTYEYANPHYVSGPVDSLPGATTSEFSPVVADANARNIVTWYGVTYEEATEAAAYVSPEVAPNVAYFKWRGTKAQTMAS